MKRFAKTAVEQGYDPARPITEGELLGLLDTSLVTKDELQRVVDQINAGFKQLRDHIDGAAEQTVQRSIVGALHAREVRKVTRNAAGFIDEVTVLD